MLAAMTGIEKLLKAHDGSPAAIAQQLHTDERPCRRQDVQYWRKKGYVPGTWAPLVASKFGVPLHELNPNIYPKSTGQAA